jgi:hypothetical protein
MVSYGFRIGCCRMKAGENAFVLNPTSPPQNWSGATEQPKTRTSAAGGRSCGCWPPGTRPLRSPRSLAPRATGSGSSSRATTPRPRRPAQSPAYDLLARPAADALRRAAGGGAPGAQGANAGGRTSEGARRRRARAVAAWVTAWMSAKLGRPVRVQRGGEYLQRLKHSQQLPRPGQAVATPEAHAACNKPAGPCYGRAPPPAPTRRGRRGRWTSTGSAARRGTRRGWGGPSGQRPRAGVPHRGRWRSRGGRCPSRLGPDGLAAGRGRRDPAGRSGVGRLRAGGRGRPPAADQARAGSSRLADASALQPAEHVWPLPNAPLVNRHVADLDALDKAQCARCAARQRQPARIRSATLSPGGPDAARNTKVPDGTDINGRRAHRVTKVSSWGAASSAICAAS